MPRTAIPAPRATLPIRLGVIVGLGLDAVVFLEHFLLAGMPDAPHFLSNLSEAVVMGMITGGMYAILARHLRGHLSWVL